VFSERLHHYPRQGHYPPARFRLGRAHDDLAGDLGRLLDENGPDELLRQVRAAEAVDPEGRQWPRTKRSDDATAVYLALS
jgi:hypothetical protein